MPIVGQGGALAEIDDATVAYAEFDRLVTWLDRTIEQQAIRQRAVEQAGHQPPDVQDIGVHQDHRMTAVHDLASGVQRNDAALAEIRVDQHGYGRSVIQLGQRGTDERAREAGDHGDRGDAGSTQDLDVPGEQAFAAELQQGLRLAQCLRRAVVQPAAYAGGQYQGARLR